MTAKEALKGISEELKKLTPVPFEDTQYYQVLKDVIEELEAIKSVDYNNTIKMLKGMHLITLDPLESTNEKEREELLYARKKADKTNAKLETAINALHKAQAQEKELAELKEKQIKVLPKVSIHYEHSELKYARANCPVCGAMVYQTCGLLPLQVAISGERPYCQHCGQHLSSNFSINENDYNVGI
jgi:hypothetical protein